MPPRPARVLAVPMLMIVGFAPVSVHAQPEGEEAASDEALAPEVEEAKQLFNEGATKFETADYAGAIELWTKAYGIVPNQPEYAAIKAKLIANLASAQERAYAVDHQVEHLNQAKILLESYRSVIADIYPSAEERDKELAWVSERVGKIDAELSAVAEREAAAAQNQGGDQPEPEAGPPPGRGFVIGGAVLSGLGAGGLGLMIGGMVMGSGSNDISDLASNDIPSRRARFEDGRLGNALAIAGGVAGGVLLTTGVALIVVGVKRNAAAKQEKAQAMVIPQLAPGWAGLGVIGRF